MHGLEACDLCGRQVPTEFPRSKLWRLGWEWAPIVRCAVVSDVALPVSSRTRWTCAACWPWELLAVEVLDNGLRSTFGAAKVLQMIRTFRAQSMTLVQAVDWAAAMTGRPVSQQLLDRIADDLVKHANNINEPRESAGWPIAGAGRTVH